MAALAKLERARRADENRTRLFTELIVLATPVDGGGLAVFAPTVSRAQAVLDLFPDGFGATFAGSSHQETTTYQANTAKTMVFVDYNEYDGDFLWQFLFPILQIGERTLVFVYNDGMPHVRASASSVSELRTLLERHAATFPDTSHYVVRGTA